MVFIDDVYLWCLLMMFIYDVYLWCFSQFVYLLFSKMDKYIMNVTVRMVNSQNN